MKLKKAKGVTTFGPHSNVTLHCQMLSSSLCGSSPIPVLPGINSPHFTLSFTAIYIITGRDPTKHRLQLLRRGSDASLGTE